MNAAEIRTEVDRLVEVRKLMLQRALNYLRERQRQQDLAEAELHEAELCRQQIEFLEGKLQPQTVAA
jgi:uncharacterized protein YnzC (UPF0291/DUF896 family)